jgi:site-specific recombinase XerD
MADVVVADVISKAEQELLQLRYSKVSMTYYRRIFKKIGDFFIAQGEMHFDDSTAMSWLNGECDFTNKEKRNELSQDDVGLYRAVRTLVSISKGEKIPVQYSRKAVEIPNETVMDVLNRLSEFSKTKGYANSTQHLHRTTAVALFRFLLERKLYPSQVNPQIVSEFIRTCGGFSKKTMESKMYALRFITQFLYDDGIAQINCSPMLPKVTAPRFTTLPSVWSREDIAKLFAAIDKTNPLGKRDYAILLIALRLGVRGCDIKRLKVGNFDFKNKKEIRYIQSKTGKVSVLPLLPDIGWAVLNYLKDGRPRGSNSPYIFVTHIAPYGELAEDNHMYNMVVKYARRAGISLRHDQKYGIHSLRHTLATTLLEQGVSTPNISNILEHEKTDTTNIYLKKGIEFLRECALDAEFQEDAADV